MNAAPEHDDPDHDADDCCEDGRLASSPDPVDADERRVALYLSGHRLTAQMRRKRAQLEDAVAAGVDAVGIDRIVDLATVSWELGHHADHHHGARAELARRWPDCARWKLAGQLAEAPVWGLEGSVSTSRR